MKIYTEILNAKAERRKLLAILLDPDKIVWESIEDLALKINQSPATHIFIGGSLVKTNKTDDLISRIRSNSNLPIVLFPGNPSQISPLANGILFLSLLSGRNADYLIEHHVNSVPLLKKTNLEIIPTGYILIESGGKTAVEKVSGTKPLSRSDAGYALQTAQAGEMLGKKMIYLEAGSGAKLPVPAEMIKTISENIKVPLIVGGGITTLEGIEKAYLAGADLVVIGTAFENNADFFLKSDCEALQLQPKP